MPRAPFQVLVLPFLRSTAGPVLYCPLRRADGGWWQWIAGGGEDAEKPQEAAVRETLEETGLDGPLYALQSNARVPVGGFAYREFWLPDLYVIPEYHYAVEATSPAITLSHEHTEYRWAEYQAAFDLLRWQSNQTALWELNERLKRGELERI